MTTAARDERVGEIAAALRAAQLLVSARCDETSLTEVLKLLMETTRASSVTLRPEVGGLPERLEAAVSPPRAAAVRLSLPLRYGDQSLGTLAVAATHALPLAHEQSVALVADMLALALSDFASRRMLAEAEADRRRLVARFIDATERERAELAGQLHDGPLQSLVAARYVTDMAGLALRDATFDEARRGVQAGLVNARRALWQLRPHASDGTDLAGALESLGRQLSDFIGLHVELTVSALPAQMPPSVASAVFRLVQEMLSASVRERAATSATVAAEIDGGTLVVTVTDDGVGQVVEVPPGLARWREWVSLLGGEVRLRGKRGGGAWMRARLPMTDGTEDVMSA
jgi:signal transduction histidine kinase